MGLFSMIGLGGTMQANASSPGVRNPADDFWYGRVGKTSAAGVKVSIESARTVPVVRGCLQVLSETVAGLSFSVFERGEGDQRQKRSDHPVARLLADPNPRETSYEFFANMVDDLASHGRFLAERQSWGREERLWRISPDHFRVEMLPDRSLRFRITEPGRGERVLLDDDAWYIPLPPIQDGMTGRSPILQDGVEAIGAALALQRYANSFFANDATPPVIFRHTPRRAGTEALRPFQRGDHAEWLCPRQRGLGRDHLCQQPRPDRDDPE